MDKKFHEYKSLDLSRINQEVLKEWEENKTFEESLKTREGNPSFVFYEGPPSRQRHAWHSPCNGRERSRM